MEKVGEFRVGPKGLWAQDPCYGYCGGFHLANVVPGTWVASVVHTDAGAWGKRVKELRVRCASRAVDWSNPKLFKREKTCICVDAGQAGFFDEDAAQDLDDGHDQFFVRNGDATVFERAVVSDSGLGDGGYDLYTHRDHAGLVVAAKLVFME